MLMTEPWCPLCGGGCSDVRDLEVRGPRDGVMTGWVVCVRVHGTGALMRLRFWRAG